MTARARAPTTTVTNVYPSPPISSLSPFVSPHTSRLITDTRGDRSLILGLIHCDHDLSYYMFEPFLSFFLAFWRKFCAIYIPLFLVLTVLYPESYLSFFFFNS